MIGTAGYNACIGFKFAALPAQSGKANARALSKLNVVVVHLSTSELIKEYIASIAPGRRGWQPEKTSRATAPEGPRKKGPVIRDGRQV
jgi:hypothetical protein